MFKTVIVIPCYKVEKYIIHVLKKIPLRKIFKVILVDDNCPNNTGKYVKKKIKNKKIKVIFLKKNLGVGGATKAGIKDAIKHKADIIIKLDGDGQHNPVHLSGFINLQKKNPNTYIKGFRELDYKKIPFSRYLGNIVITFILRFLTNNQNLKDVVIQGGLDPKILLKSDDEIFKAATKYIQTFKDTPYIFNLGHGLLPETDPDKVDKLIKFYRNFNG